MMEPYIVKRKKNVDIPTSVAIDPIETLVIANFKR